MHGGRLESPADEMRCVGFWIGFSLSLSLFRYIFLRIGNFSDVCFDATLLLITSSGWPKQGGA
jgi:hypothetical protein